MEIALKQQQTNGTKSNRHFPKEDYVKPHKRSKLDLQDQRVVKVKFLISHPRRCPNGMIKEIESFEVERETRKFERDGYKVELI
jgi:hypothetical protein